MKDIQLSTSFQTSGDFFCQLFFFCFVKVVEIAIQAIIFNVQCNKSWMYC